MMAFQIVLSRCFIVVLKNCSFTYSLCCCDSRHLILSRYRHYDFIAPHKGQCPRRIVLIQCGWPRGLNGFAFKEVGQRLPLRFNSPLGRAPAKSYNRRVVSGLFAKLHTIIIGLR